MSKSKDKSNSSASGLPVDLEEELTSLIRQAQKYPAKSIESRKAKTKIMSLIQQSDLLSRQESDFPEELCAQAKQNLLIDICHNIHKYDPARGAIATEIESKFAELLQS